MVNKVLVIVDLLVVCFYFVDRDDYIWLIDYYCIFYKVICIVYCYRCFFYFGLRYILKSCYFLKGKLIGVKIMYVYLNIKFFYG